MGAPVISFVGKSNAGKTTLIEKLIANLKQRGFRVGVVKHDVHGFEMDRPGKDTWRFSQAGGDAVAIAGPDQVAIIERIRDEVALDEVVARIAPRVDVILTEGYRREGRKKVEVCRAARSPELICSESELLAIVSDLRFPVEVPHFDLDDVAGLADFLLRAVGLPARQPTA